MPLFALEGALQTWLREQLPLPADVGDICFDSPDVAWSSALTRPTVNLFLFDIARAAQPAIPVPPRRDPAGGLVQDRPAPCVTFSYLLSTWGGGVRQEHQLLGDAMRAVLSTPTLNPEPQNREPMGSPLIGPVQLGLSEPNGVRARELWSGLGGRLRPGLVLVATGAVPLGRTRPLAPPVRVVETEVRPPARTGRRAAVTERSGAGQEAGLVQEAGLAEEPAPVEKVVPAEKAAADDDSTLSAQAPRRFVWLGPGRQRGRGRR